MRCEVNFAEFQHQIDCGTISMDACRRMGSTHRAYGWSCTPYGHWDDERKAAYRQGYANAN